jgi:hypothetical protein
MRSRNSLFFIPAIVLCAGRLSAIADTVTLVNDTWQDSTRTDPAAPIYAENNGTTASDADADGNLESAWFRAGGGTLTAAPNDLQGTGFNGGSASWYTYFTGSSPVTLVNVGDQLSLTWTFIPRSVNSANANQGFNLALALTPAGTRATADGTSPSGTFLGYSMFMNMAPTFGNANSFQLRKWATPGASGALLGTAGNWSSVTNGATTGGTGYASDTEYTYTLTLTRNASAGLDVVSTMSGGSLNSTGALSVAYTDTSASQGYSFDTFDIRPTSSAQSAGTFDTELFMVQLTSAPEPSVMAFGIVAGMCVIFRRRK